MPFVPENPLRREGIFGHVNMGAFQLKQVREVTETSRDIEWRFHHG
jgi:hypothetical protein